VGQAVADDLNGRGRACVLIDDAARERYLTPAGEDNDSLQWFCSTLVSLGVLIVVAISAPTQSERERFRGAITNFIEVFLDAPIATCTQRSGRADANFENPHAPELRVPTSDRAVAASAAQVISFLEQAGLIVTD